MEDKEYLKEINKIVKCHLMLAGLQELKYNIDAKNKLERAVFNNLKQISTHAGEKRFGMGEIFEHTNLLALCQYEFMINKSLNYVTSDVLLIAMNECLKGIKEVRNCFNCPPFKSKDEIVIVETIIGDKVKAIIPENLDVWMGEYNRLLPIDPEHQFSEFSKNMGGFLNYNGDVEETVKFVLG